MISSLKLAAAFFTHPKRTGAIVQSSDKLCDAMLDDVDWAKVRCVIELGPGTGVLTEKIKALVSSNCLFLVIEKNEDLAKSLQYLYHFLIQSP